MVAYYNELDPFAAAWLRELIKEGLIADGEVDERSIADVRGADLDGFIQCHFFAGIGGWSYALRLAGWPDDRPVWTGSCPCQPFSSAGAGKGERDERHLWPAWFRLIDACRPPVIFGEQVASKAALRWFSRKGSDVQTMLDREAVFGVLCELERQSERQVQGVRLRVGARQETRRAAQGGAPTSRMANETTGLCIGERREVSGAGAATAIRSRPGRYSAADRSGRLRINGDRLRLDVAAIVERAVTGSDQGGAGLYDGQRASGSLFPECHGERVGSRQDYGDCVGDYESTSRAEQRLADLIDGAAEEDASNRRPFSVLYDLENADYAVAAVCLPGPVSGAFDIRQRLWFVAESDGRDQSQERARDESGREQPTGRRAAERAGVGTASRDGGLADTDVRDAEHRELQRSGEHGLRVEDRHADRAARDTERPEVGGLADCHTAGRDRQRQPGLSGDGHAPCRDDADGCGEPRGLADTEHAERRPLRLDGGCDGPHAGREEAHGEPGTCREVRDLADADDARRRAGRDGGSGDGRDAARQQPAGLRAAGELGDADEQGLQERQRDGRLSRAAMGARARQAVERGSDASFWADVVWLPCRDGKARPVEPTIFPLAAGLPNRVGLLRGAGNAIKPQVAAEVIRAYLSLDRDA